MNEEIDVSGCIFKVIRYCKIQTHILGDNARCDVNKKCYYKQLKRYEQKLEKIKEIATKYSQREGYLLGGLFADLVDELNEVLKDE